MFFVSLSFGLILLKFIEPVPVSFNFNDEENWNYKIEPHDDPVLNGSNHNFLLPIYSFAKELNVQGLHTGSNYSNGYLPTIHREAKIVGDIIRTKISCNVCNLGVGLLYREVKTGSQFEDIKIKFVSLCVTFQIATLGVCTGIFDTYGPEIIPAIDAISISPTDVCKMIFGEVCIAPEVTAHDWTVNLPDLSSKPQTVSTTLPKENLPVFKVLQISDTHYDLDYVEGAVANCQEPLCCRTYSTPRENEEIVPAGRWGSYEKCDASRDLLKNMLDHISLQHPDIDYILWTGDLPPHDIWNQTKENNLKNIKETIQLVVDAFPNTPIFPAIGNHEASPAGNFAPPWMKDPAHATSWLYDEIVESWSHWLPDISKKTVQHGAFYSIALRPGFRLISVNTNYCHAMSWWLFVNSTDPASELKWLINELQQAESKEEKVHIIGHIAPGSADCMKSWSKNFNEIVNRFEDTIKGLFYGHSHADEFEVFYETNGEYNSKSSLMKKMRWWKTKRIEELKFTDKPTAIAYLAPSVTTYTNHNPAYRIYYVDGDHNQTNREILDHETWTFDLSKANMNDNEPEWYKLYSAKEVYQMASLRPTEWAKLVEKLTTDQLEFDKFYRNYYRNSPETPVCDTNCRVEILCDLKSAKSHSRHQLCHELEAVVTS